MTYNKHLLGYALSLALGLGFSTFTHSSTIDFVVGGYTDKGGEGIYSVTLDTTTNKFGPLQTLAKTTNPSYGLQNNNNWYFVNESADGQLVTYSESDKGELNFLQKVSVAGKSPCYIAKRNDDKYLAVANYNSGNLAVFELDSKGLPKGKPQLKQHDGSGPNSKRQDAPHTHWAGWSQLSDNKKTTGIYVVDLGADKIFWYPQNSKGKLGDAQVAYNAAPGDGPRHLAFHPKNPWVYVVNELSNTVSFTQQAADGHLTEAQKISTVPNGFNGNNTAAHIVISADGKHLYVSNRGDFNTIEVFDIADDGRLTAAQSISSQGRIPRYFVLLDDAKKLLITNQESNNLVVMNVLPNGQLAYFGVQTSIPSPTFVALK
jgi:6-phosphogluconolactonase